MKSRRIKTTRGNKSGRTRPPRNAHKEFSRSIEKMPETARTLLRRRHDMRQRPYQLPQHQLPQHRIPGLLDPLPHHRIPGPQHQLPQHRIPGLLDPLPHHRIPGLLQMDQVR